MESKPFIVQQSLLSTPKLFVNRCGKIGQCRREDGIILVTWHHIGMAVNPNLIVPSSRAQHNLKFLWKQVGHDASTLIVRIVVGIFVIVVCMFVVVAIAIFLHMKKVGQTVQGRLHGRMERMKQSLEHASTHFRKLLGWYQLLNVRAFRHPKVGRKGPMRKWFKFHTDNIALLLLLLLLLLRVFQMKLRDRNAQQW